MQNKNVSAYAWLVWFVAALFYGIEYFQRVSPTVMAKPLMESFHLSAAAFGAVTSLYFYAYAAAQIPVGLLLDRYGARRLLSLACFTVSLGSFLFAAAQLIWLLVLARILIGFGSAFAFIGVLKLTASWFSARQYPLMVGLTNTLGVVGAIAGEAPLAKLVATAGWQKSMIITSLVGCVISLLVWLLIRDRPSGLGSESANDRLLAPSLKTKAALKDVFKDRQTWITALYAGLMVAPIISFAELWAVPFLTRNYALSSVDAAQLNSAIFMGIGVGGPLLGWLSGRLNRRRLLMGVGNLFAFMGLLLIIYTQFLNEVGLFILLFFFGFFTSSMLIAFTLNKHRHSLDHSATVVAFTNMMIMIIGALYQPAIGWLLDRFIPAMQPGVYTLPDFHRALVILPLTSLVSLLLLYFLKDAAASKAE